MSKHILISIVVMCLGGCATTPEIIRTPVPGPGVAEVRADPVAHAGSRVRWGGTVRRVENLENRTEVIVVARPITRGGEPLGGERSMGRFLATTGRFLDPAEYEAGRRITVVGTVTGVRPGKVGDYVYDYPVVQAQDIYLWEEYVRRDPDPFYGWPYYDPFWYPYPWRYHRFGHPYPWYY